MISGIHAVSFLSASHSAYQVLRTPTDSPAFACRCLRVGFRCVEIGAVCLHALTEAATLTGPWGAARLELLCHITVEIVRPEKDPCLGVLAQGIGPHIRLCRRHRAPLRQ